MATNGEDIVKLARAGQISLQELQQTAKSASNADVNVQDWGVCYSSGSNQLSEYCTVVATNPGNPITGIGMLAYSSNGLTLYAAQYTNGFSSDAVYPSVATNQYNPQSGNQILCVVYGWTEQGSFYITQTLTVGSCD